MFISAKCLRQKDLYVGCIFHELVSATKTKMSQIISRPKLTLNNLLGNMRSAKEFIVQKLSKGIMPNLVPGNQCYQLDLFWPKFGNTKINVKVHRSRFTLSHSLNESRVWRVLLLHSKRNEKEPHEQENGSTYQ